MKIRLLRRLAFTGLSFVLMTTSGCACNHAHDHARSGVTVSPVSSHLSQAVPRGLGS